MVTRLHTVKKAVLLSSCLVVLSFLLVAGCKPNLSEQGLNEFVGGHARAVWVRQVAGDGDDPFCESDQLILMGLDSDDDSGERRIMPKVGNYRKPLMTPDGSGVVFTRYTENAFYHVSWNGNGLRKLADGCAVTVWRDASTGIDWVYYISGPIDEEQNFLGTPLKRCHLDDPAIQELVWDKTPMNLDNIQLSQDGTQLAGLFPWPLAGVVDLPSQTLRKIGKGCWTSISPDNRYLVWFFDGAHKNVLIRPLDGSPQQKIRINSGAGSRRDEAYHPRWSNHSRYLTMTGPYQNKGRYNNIGGGGIGINAYIGKFNVAFSAIEQWFQLTDHPHADFFPDLWVENAAEASIAEPANKSSAQSANTIKWPVDSSGLLYVWDNSKSANGINDPELGYYRCAAVRKGKVRYSRFNEMLTSQGYFQAEGSKALETQEEKSDQEFTVMLNLRATGVQPTESGVIMAKGNYGLVQIGNTLHWVSGPDETSAELIEIVPGENYHIAISYTQEGGAQAFVQGQPLSGVEGSAILNIVSDEPLVFGGLPGNRADWSGAIDGVAWYGRSLSSSQIAAEYASYLESRPANRNDSIPRVIVDARLIETSPMPTPEGIAPYRSALVEYLYAVEKIIEGSVLDDQIIVQHWAILDAVSYPLNREVGQNYRLELESLEDHPELEGERISSELIEPVDIYLDVETE